MVEFGADAGVIVCGFRAWRAIFAKASRGWASYRWLRAGRMWDMVGDGVEGSSQGISLHY